MSEELSPQVTSDMGAVDTVARRSENLTDQSKDVATNLYGIDKATQEIQAEGVLTEDEKNNNQYTEREFQAMSVEDKKNFLAELQSLAKEKSPMFVLELQKNKKEGQLFKLAMAYSKTEQELQQKMEAFKNKKAAIEATHEEQALKATEKYEKDSEKIKNKSKGKIRKLASKLKKDSSVKEFRGKTQELNSLGGYFGFQRSEEMSKGIAGKRDEVKEDSSVSNLIDQISAERSDLDEKLQERKQQLLTELANIEQGTKRELSQLKGSTLTELSELKQQLSQIEQERDQAEQEFTDLEAQIEDKQRLQNSVDLLKDELREFSFADGQEIMADLENRSANTLSMESLSADKGNFEGQLDTILNGANELEKALDEARQLAENANTNSYYDQMDKLTAEKDGLKGEKEKSHNDLVKELNEPFAEAIEKARSTSAEQLREGASAIELVSLLSSLGGEVKKAEKSINKSSEGLNKFIAKLEQRFTKLQAKLDESKHMADYQLDSSVTSVSENIFTAQTIAEQAKEGDFSQVAEKESWLKTTFSKLFSKK